MEIAKQKLIDTFERVEKINNIQHDLFSKFERAVNLLSLEERITNLEKDNSYINKELENLKDKIFDSGYKD